MGIETTPQLDTNTIFQVAQQIFAALKTDPVLAPYYQSKYMHLDWWVEQPFFENEYPLPELCFYLSVDVVETTNERENRDRLKVNYTIYMEWRSNADTHQGALTQENSLLFYPWQNAMHRCLAGLKTDGMFSALRRVAAPSQVPGIERKGLLLSSTYQCLVIDETASPEEIKAHIHHLQVGGHVIVPAGAV